MSKLTGICFDSKERYENKEKNKKDRKINQRNDQIKILKFIYDKPMEFKFEKEKDLYYDNGVGYVELHPLCYPKYIFKFSAIENLFISKSITRFCKSITLTDFLRLYETQNGRLINRCIIINDDAFISTFYTNPGKHWKNFVSKVNYNLLICLHTIAVDTTLFRLTSELNSNQIKESIFCCVLHVLLLEQLLPHEVNEKQFVIEIRKRLFLAITYVVKQEKLFTNIKEFFTLCMQYYLKNRKELLLNNANLHAVDFRFQRYITQMEQN